MPAPWQLCFDDGHQQRYLPDRQSVLRYILAIAGKSASKRFEVFAESAPVRLTDGTESGRTFALVEVIDVSRAGEIERLQAELSELAPGSGRGGLPAPPEPPTAGVRGSPGQRGTR
jgi:hypothetical protein